MFYPSFTTCVLTLLFHQSRPRRHSESYEMWLPLCSKDGCLPAVIGNHHFLARDLSLPTPPPHWTTCGQSNLLCKKYLYYLDLHFISAKFYVSIFCVPCISGYWQQWEMKIEYGQKNVFETKICNITFTPVGCRIWTAAACVWTRSSAAIAMRGRSALRASLMMRMDTIRSTAAAIRWSQTPPAMTRRPRKLKVRSSVIQS